MKKILTILKYSLKYEIWHYGVFKGTISIFINVFVCVVLLLTAIIFSPVLLYFSDINASTLEYFLCGIYSVIGIISFVNIIREFEESATRQKILDSITARSLEMSFTENISQELEKIKNYIDDFTRNFERKKNEINEIEKSIQELNKQIENQTEIKKLIDIDKNKIAEALFSNSYYKRKEIKSLILGFMIGLLSSILASIMLKLL